MFGAPPGPHGITICGELVYCVDNTRHVGRIFDLEGNEVACLGDVDNPSLTGFRPALDDTLYVHLATIKRGAGPFNRPTKAAVGPDGDVFVADGYGNSRVHRFSPQGELLASWGEPGPQPGQFYVVHHVAMAPDGRVLVCDRENERIQFFEADGTYVEEWTDVQHPAAVAVSALGIYVAELSWSAGDGSFQQGPIQESRPARLSLLGEGGSVIARWPARPPGAVRDTGPVFAQPHGIAVDSVGHLYVADVAAAHDRMLQKYLVR